MSSRVRTGRFVAGLLAGVLLATGLGFGPTSQAAFTASTANTGTAFSATDSFGLVQGAGTTGCISETGTSGSCVDGQILTDLRGLDITNDGATVYTGSYSGDGVNAYARNPTTGALTALGGASACITDSGAAGCTNGRALNGTYTVDATPDGKFVYVAAEQSNAVAVLARNTTTGALSQPVGATGCASENGTEDGSTGICYDGRALQYPDGVVVSPDGANVYVSSYSSDAVSVFSRNTTTGALTQLAGTAGCVSLSGTGGTCATGRALNGATFVAISPNGATVYVMSQISNAIAVFSRNAGTGALTQLAGTAGCISEDGTSGTCTDVTGMTYATGIVFSPDGTFAYTSSGNAGVTTLGIYARNPTTGALTQLAGTNGCISSTGTAGACQANTLLTGVTMPAISPGGQNVYAPAVPTGVLNVFYRNATTGILTQTTSAKKCISNTGNAGACLVGRAMGGIDRVVVSPDSRDVYATTNTDNAVLIFARTH